MSSQAATSILSELKTVAQVSSVIETLNTILKFLRTDDRNLSHKKDLKVYIQELKLPVHGGTTVSMISIIVLIKCTCIYNVGYRVLSVGEHQIIVEIVEY